MPFLSLSSSLTITPSLSLSHFHCIISSLYIVSLFFSRPEGNRETEKLALLFLLSLWQKRLALMYAQQIPPLVISGCFAFQDWKKKKIRRNKVKKKRNPTKIYHLGSQLHLSLHWVLNFVNHRFKTYSYDTKKIQLYRFSDSRQAFCDIYSCLSLFSCGLYQSQLKSAFGQVPAKGQVITSRAESC